MALTKIKTNAIDDDAVTLAKQAAGTDGQIITYDASGNPTAVGPGTDGQVLTSTGAGSPPAFEAIPAGVGGSTGVDFNDNVKARFGTGNDLQIYHESNEDKIFSTATKLEIRSPDLQLQNSSGEKYFVGTSDGSVELYYNHVKKLETTSTGITVSGNVDVGTNKFIAGSVELDQTGLYIEDADKIYCGTGDDLQLFHNGTSSQINDTSGSIYIQSDEVNIRSNTGGETMFKGTVNGAVELYFNDVKKFETISTGINFPDDSMIRMGAGNDLNLWHDGSNSYIENKTGNLEFQAKQAETACKMIPDGAVELYYDHTKMMETQANGVTMSESLYMLDTKALYLGTGADLVLFHHTDVNYIDSRGRETYIRNLNTDGNANETMAKFIPNGAVKLYNDNSKKIETSGSGVTVYGTVTETSDVALKEDITPLSNSLTNLKQLNGYSYKFKDTGIKSLGVTAQDVEKVYPDLVEGEEGQKSLNYSGLIAPLIEAVKELSVEVETLKTKVAALEAK